MEAQRKATTSQIPPEFALSLDSANAFSLYLGRKARGIHGERMAPFVCCPPS